MDEAATQVAPRRRRGWMIGGAVTAVLLGTATVWFLSGPKIWTDGTTVRISDRGTRVREVVWTRPQSLEGFASDEQVYEPSLSPDGTELYFVRGKAGQNAKIYLSLRRNNAWSAPTAVDAVNGPSDSLGPRVTGDGKYLLFYSNRPGGFGGYDIWAAPRTQSGWGEPFNLGSEVNSEFNEFNPDPTPDGRRLIFVTNRMAAKREQNEAWRSTIRETVSSDYDLWIADASPSLAAQAGGAPATQPTTLPARPLAYHHAREIPGVNTSYTEGASCMSPAGDFLYFASNRPGGFGKFDIYRCRVHGDDFEPVENAGLPINSVENEADPALAFNGFRMFFSSDRPGADGRYHLLASDSREVYPERQARPLPHLGWSWWILIISLLALVPLLLMMRGWEDQRFSMLQKCLLMSLLVHALITFLLSFVAVTQQMAKYVRQEMQMEVAINLGDSRGVDETLAIRSQMSGELPVSSIAPPSMAPVKVESESLAAPAAMAMDVPVSRVAPGAMMTLAAPAPRVGTPARQEIAAAAQVTPSAAAEPTIDASRLVLNRVTQSETTPQSAAVQQSGEKQAATSDVTAASNASAGRMDVPVGAVPAGITSGVDVQSPRLATGLAGGVSDGKVAPLTKSASAAGPEPALDGLLPRVAKAVGTEPTFGLARQEPTTRSTADAGTIAQQAPQRVELAGAARVGPSTMPSSALASAAPQPLGKSGMNLSASAIPQADSKVANDAQISLRTRPFVGSEAKLVSGKPEQPRATGAVAAAGPIGTREPVSRPGIVQVADAKAAHASGGSNLLAAPANPVAAVGSMKGSSQAARPSVTTGTTVDPEIAGPAIIASAGTAKASDAERTPVVGSAGQSAQRVKLEPGPVQVGVPRAIDLAPAPVVASGKALAGGRGGLGMSGVPSARAQLASAVIKPQISLSTLSGPLGPGKSVVPDLTFIRAPEQRKPMLEQLGGTKESEDAVSRGLAYLARVQEQDGHWTRIDDNQRRRSRGRGGHDMACTGFAVLAFLGHDETPDKAGPYREAVSKGVDYLVTQQSEDGDLRGAERFRGGGSDSANMYDHGIATYALAECAIMTHDPRVTEAALKGAKFIVAAQNEQSGGWRYSPNEFGDSSVFGWQIMALHSAEQVGFEIPAETLDGAKRYIASCGEGRYKLLAGYQPHNGPTAPMTAELLFSRMLLGVELLDEGIDEATRFLARQPPDPQNADLYYWYYASLSMLHMQNPLWKDWNILTRESLIRMQESEGPSAGSWATNMKWGDRGGKVFTTALATLTLEVYYRYLPMRKAVETQAAPVQR